jgi:NAD(P)-dependent dehydrogenase (short-subunit alcohol dehydrogenase family)
MSEKQQSEKLVALVTGGNKGLGLEITKQLAERGYTVLLGAREDKGIGPAKKLEAAGLDVHPVKLDVTNEHEIAAVAKMIAEKFGKLDVLVNNAGVNRGGKEPTAEDLRQTYEANVIGPYELTRKLLPLLKKSKGGRVVNQSSILGSLETIASGDASRDAWLLPAYLSSKSALNMLTVVLAKQLEGTKVKVNAAHPGWVKTDMGGEAAPLEVEEGAKTAVELATIGEDGPTGGFQHLGKTLPW